MRPASATHSGMEQRQLVSGHQLEVGGSNPSPATQTTEYMIQSYKIKDIRVTTYDGRIIETEMKGIFQGPRLKIENMILESVRNRIKNDIPVRATFRMVPI